MAKTSNAFKAADARKKRKNESEKAVKFIGQLEEVLNTPSDKLSQSDIASAQASLDKLKEVSADASVEIEVLMTANEDAQSVLDQISDKLNAAEEPAVVEETVPEQEPVAEEVKSTPEVPADVVPEVKGEETEEVIEAPAKPVAKELTEEEKEKQALSELLHDLYSSPRYSRLKGETKKRFSALIKPTLIEKMRMDQEEGRITSPNDLINGLLEIYYGEY